MGRGGEAVAVQVAPDEIAAALERARCRACPPHGRDCLAFAAHPEDPVPDADGEVDIGWIHDPGTLVDWHALYHPATVEGRLGRWLR